MAANNEFVIPLYSEKTKQLMEDTLPLLEGEEVATTYDEGKYLQEPLSLVFAGQYSAGKSTIIKALTGIESIKTGHEITTEQAQEYDWRGIKVIDTPGISTGLRPDHDEIALRAIANADMLAYVVTYAGFDSLIAEDFRDLLIAKQKADEMILVVNKMRDANEGNTESQQQIIYEDLAEVTSPFDPSQIGTVFIDAEDYLKSIRLAVENPERAERRRQQSNFDSLVEALNNCVERKGYAAKLTTPLYRLRDRLELELRDSEKSQSNAEEDAIEEALYRKKAIARNAIREISASTRCVYTEKADAVRKEGRKLADTIQKCKTKDEVDDLKKQTQNRVDQLFDECYEGVGRALKDADERYVSELQSFYSSELIQDIVNTDGYDKDAPNPILKMILDPKYIEQGGKILVDKAAGADTIVAGLKIANVENVHDAVLEVGHFLGHKFKPWEAAKIAEKLKEGAKIAGKALQIVAAVLDIILQYKEDRDAVEAEKAQRQQREEIRGFYNTMGDNLENHYRDKVKQILLSPEGLQSQIDAIENELYLIRSRRENNSKKTENLIGAIKRCDNLIAEIHEAFPA